ncbi:MAG: HTTM domain-containing protein [Planctomycetota bacterium]
MRRNRKVTRRQTDRASDGDWKTDLLQLVVKLRQPVCGASLAFYRFGFGMVLCWWAIDYLRLGITRDYYVLPAFFFKYPLFAWVKPLPEQGMYLLFGLLAVISFGFAIGFLYRVFAPALAIIFTYIFLLDSTNYQNHYYLVSILGWTHVWVPLANRYSLDSLLFSSVRHAPSLQRCHLWLLRFQIAVPYFFGGLAKMESDWLTGVPMRQFLENRGLAVWGFSPDVFPLLGLLFCWGGLVFDLLIVPLLIWKRTRILACVLATGFHLTNAFLFDIHIFPWFMLIATTIFLEPDWPFRVISRLSGRSPNASRNQHAVHDLEVSRTKSGIRLKPCVTVLLLIVYVIVPFRGAWQRGETSWTERGHCFSWRMMLRSKRGGIRYFLTDPETGVTETIDHTQFLCRQQVGKFARDPEKIRQLAHFLADQFEQQRSTRPHVRAIALISLNGRRPQLLVDPNVDLAIQTWTLTTPSWIEPLREPLRAESWDLPLAAWMHVVPLPRLPYLDNIHHRATNEWSRQHGR